MALGLPGTPPTTASLSAQMEAGTSAGNLLLLLPSKAPFLLLPPVLLPAFSSFSLFLTRPHQIPCQVIRTNLGSRPGVKSDVRPENREEGRECHLYLTSFPPTLGTHLCPLLHLPLWLDGARFSICIPDTSHPERIPTATHRLHVWFRGLLISELLPGSITPPSACFALQATYPPRQPVLGRSPTVHPAVQTRSQGHMLGVCPPSIPPVSVTRLSHAPSLSCFSHSASRTWPQASFSLVIIVPVFLSLH